VVTQWKSLDVFGLRQRQELVPRQRHRVFDQTADLETPVAQIDRGDVAQIEHRPVLHDMLADGQLRHPVTIRRTGAHRGARRRIDVDALGVQRLLALDVAKTAFDDGIHEIGPVRTTYCAASSAISLSNRDFISPTHFL
jgi:hypothetical protein